VEAAKRRVSKMESKKRPERKRPYEKPQVIYRAALEAYAETCPLFKDDGGGPNCLVTQKS
jgi:hypothetical protein